MTTNDQYALNWSNHTNHIRKAFDSLLAGNEFVDVTLTCEGKKVSAHKMLLSACSTYFHDLFRENPCQHPIVILKDVKFQNLVDILKFMYNGEVSVAMENFDSFLKTAELLQVSGLTDDENRFGTENESETSDKPRIMVKDKSLDPTNIKSVTKKLSIEKSKEKEPQKKRTNDSSSDESTSQKKRKEAELRLEDVEIKQEEADVVNLEEEALESRDPLELDEHSESIEGTDLLQPPASSQKFADVQDLLNDVRNLENKCPLCLKTFTHPLSLVQHRHVHTGSTKCPICKVIFSRRYNLKTHMRNVHGNYEILSGYENDNQVN